MVHGELSWGVYSQMSFDRILSSMKHKRIFIYYKLHFNCFLRWIYREKVWKMISEHQEYYNVFITQRDLHIVSTVVMIVKKHNLVSWISSKTSFDDFL